MGLALKLRRKQRNMTQPMLAARVGRSTPRISELERDLMQGKAGRDRLGLLAEVCDALDLVPMLVPRERATAIHRVLQEGQAANAPVAPRRVFDEVYVDLSDDDKNSQEGSR
jgi:transcriptional regulator with XRE-family HTH domain